MGGEKTWIVMAKSEKFESTPENSGKVRVKDYVQTCCMQSDGKKGSKGERNAPTYQECLQQLCSAVCIGK